VKPASPVKEKKHVDDSHSGSHHHHKVEEVHVPKTAPAKEPAADDDGFTVVGKKKPVEKEEEKKPFHKKPYHGDKKPYHSHTGGDDRGEKKQYVPYKERKENQGEGHEDSRPQGGYKGGKPWNKPRPSGPSERQYVPKAEGNEQHWEKRRLEELKELFYKWS